MSVRHGRRIGVQNKMANYGGGGIQIPWNMNLATQHAPMQIEYQKVFLQAANTSDFSGQQQWQNWGVSYTELSVSMPPMNSVDGQNFLAFLDALNGSINVFQFLNSVCTDVRWAYIFTYNGATVNKYFRLKNPMNKAVIKSGGTAGLFDGIIFEVREAI